MVWGAITYGKKSELCILEKGKRTAMDLIRQVYEEFDTPILMEDGAPIHRAKVSKNWRVKYNMETTNWPTQSPDTNPIENTWELMRKKKTRRQYNYYHQNIA